MIAVKIIGVIILGYLLGSVSFGLILGRLWTHRDIREYGSGRTGATNVMRTAGFWAAFPTALLDIGKGTLAAYLAWVIIGSDSFLIGGYAFDRAPVAVLAGLAAVMGHVWPVFLKFKGGRGVSVVFGVILLFCWPAALISFILALLTLALTRYVSVASLLTVISMPIISAIYLVRGELRLEYLIFSIIGGLLVIFWHKDNIHRLLHGTERRIGQKVKIKDGQTG
jgi:acyl phosphate:glycerol-3-phosphate acyltransferase